MTTIIKKNEVFLKVEAAPHLHKELSEHFQFEVPGAQFMPAVKRRYWDGKIRLYSPGTGEIYVGLFDYLTDFLEQRGYDYEVEEDKYYGRPTDTEEYVTPEGTAAFIRSLRIPFKIRDYQLKGIYSAIKFRRKLLLSPTGSGKSLIIYALVRWHLLKNREILIIVPTVSLVEQLYKDFIEYGWNVSDVHKIMGGVEKYTDQPVVISTWQSIYKEPRKYFEKFDVVLGDEAHLFKSKSLTKIMTKLHSCKYRVGFTGTLDGCLTHKWILEGLFGPCEQLVKTKELMQQGYLTPLKVKCLVLKHEWGTFDSYQDEIDYLITHEKRNNLIKNLVKDLSGNTLVLFNYVE